jgi:ferric-dicitrate binding protein FerR (iron transport regulator)
MVARVQTRVYAVWREERDRRRRNRLIAVAASVLTVALGGLWVTQKFAAPQIVARIERGTAQGSVGGVVSVGDRLETGPDYGAMLRISGVEASAVSLRMAPGTRLVWRGKDRLQLLRGQVYLDSGVEAQRTGHVLVIEAADARFEHVGTQFLVALSGEELDVKVREGTVRVRAAGEVVLLESGEQGRLRREGSNVVSIERFLAATSGEAWSWVDSLAPSLEINDQNLLSVLQRAAHEGGLELRFESTQLERQARETILHGPALGMPPRQALDAILMTTGFVAVPDGDGRHLLIRRR